MSKKPIIVFEGIECSGKSSHVNNVANYLKNKKIKFLKIREPGGSVNSEKIRKLILNNNSNLNKYTDTLLYLSARSENIELIKANAGKKIILIDRFSDSTIAYQHYGMGVNLDFIRQINGYLTKKIKIDFTFINTVNKNNLIKRLKIRKKLNRYDRFSFPFYNKVQKGYLKIAAKYPKRYMIVNSNLEIEFNKKTIINKIKKII